MASEEYQEQPVVNRGTPVTTDTVVSWCATQCGGLPSNGGNLRGRPDGSRFADAPLLPRCNCDRFSLEVLIYLTKKTKNKNLFNLILDEIRSFMPEYLKNCPSNWAITRVIYGLLALVVFVSINILPARASIDMPPESAETVSIPAEVEITSDSTPTKETEETATLSNDTISIPAEIETTDTPVETKKPANLTINNTPPKPVVTPEQIFFSTIQEKINEITSQGYDDLIVSGEADLLAGRLLIKISDDWYQLDESRQDTFVNETLKRSQQFKINKLEIQDLQNNLIARSPVVGNKMIILQRSN